ncbi:MAG: type II secretion system F family protein [Clostridiaceae bacterium]|nr:type II secretion system F family protein [Clostridiaceae bacterium]
MEVLICVSGGCTVFALAMGLFYVLRKGNLRERERIEQLMQEKPKPKKSRKKDIEEGKTRKNLEKLADQLHMAGIALRAEEFFAIWFVSATLIPVLAFLAGVNVTACLGICVIGAILPIGIVKFKRAKRLAMFDRQLLDALAVMCNALRAGLSFLTAMQNIAAEMPEPISREFACVARECQMGMPMETSFNRLIERTENGDLELICSAVLIQKQVGGNLAQVLENISGTIGERVRMRGEIKTLTASGTMSGYIIGGLPLFLLLVLMFINPEYVNTFFTTTAGRLMLAVSAVMEMIGFVFVRKIVNIKM